MDRPRAGQRPAKDGVRSREPHGFYLFDHRRRTGAGDDVAGGARVHRGRVVRNLYRPKCERYVWDAAGMRYHVFDRVAGVYQHWSRHERIAEQGIAAAVYQLWRIEFADDADGRGNFIEHRAASESGWNIAGSECENGMNE